MRKKKMSNKDRTHKSKGRQAEFPPVAGAPSTPQNGDAAAVTVTAPSTEGRKAKRKTADKPKKVSALDAAAKVLAETGGTMNCQEMIAAMAEKGYWKSANGQTPAATLYSAILRELGKPDKSRFVKAERGKFGLVDAK